MQKLITRLRIKHIVVVGRLEQANMLYQARRINLIDPDVNRVKSHMAFIKYDKSYAAYKQNTELGYLVSGEVENPVHGLRTRHLHDERWTIAAHDPLSYRSSSRYTCWMQRGKWSIRTEAKSEFRCDEKHFYIKAKIRAYEGDEMIHERKWEEIAIPRDHM